MFIMRNKKKFRSTTIKCMITYNQGKSSNTLNIYIYTSAKMSIKGSQELPIARVFPCQYR